MGTRVKRVIWWGLNALGYLVWTLRLEVAIQTAGYDWFDTAIMMIITPIFILAGWWEVMGNVRVRILRNWL